MGHGFCYLWDTSLILLHAISDALIAFSYYSIPVLIWFIVRHRPGLRKVRPLFWVMTLFGTFIALCGTTHVVNILTIWWPIYWFEGCLKLATGLVSCFTAVVLYRSLPVLARTFNVHDIRGFLEFAAEMQPSVSREEYSEVLKRLDDLVKNGK